MNHASSSFPHSETLADSNHAVATTDQALQIGLELDCCMPNTSPLFEGNTAADKRALVGCDEALNNRAVKAVKNARQARQLEATQYPAVQMGRIRPKVAAVSVGTKVDSNPREGRAAATGTHRAERGLTRVVDDKVIQRSASAMRFVTAATAKQASSGQLHLQVFDNQTFSKVV